MTHPLIRLVFSCVLMVGALTVGASAHAQATFGIEYCTSNPYYDPPSPPVGYDEG